MSTTIGGITYTREFLVAMSREDIDKVVAAVGIDTKTIKGWGRMNRAAKADVLIAHGGAATAAVAVGGGGKTVGEMSLKEINAELKERNVPGRSKGDLKEKRALLAQVRGEARAPLAFPTTSASTSTPSAAPSAAAPSAIDDLEKKTVSELEAMMKGFGLKGPTVGNKPEKVARLRSHLTPASSAVAGPSFLVTQDDINKIVSTAVSHVTATRSR